MNIAPMAKSPDKSIENGQVTNTLQNHAKSAKISSRNELQQDAVPPALLQFEATKCVLETDLGLWPSMLNWLKPVVCPKCNHDTQSYGEPWKIEISVEGVATNLWDLNLTAQIP